MLPRKATRDKKGEDGKTGGFGRSLVVVESPAKARTISRILGSGYEVRASVGHVRDLPKRDLGVDIEDGFRPKYVVPKEKARTVQEIREAAQRARTLYLATDPDREGEAIAWHILEAARLKDVPHRRVVFHEITPEAVQEAFRHPRDIDMHLVDAQQARRVVDRLVGYRLSPFLWRKVHRGLSAGRVQSVALRLVVEREREIQAFQPQEYWVIEAQLEKEGAPPAFRAKLIGYAGQRRKLEVPSAGEAQRIGSDLRSSTYGVLSTDRRQQPRKPPPPFITSTLQQEASRRLGFATKRTMALAQQLYEGVPLPEGEVGLITYMRTDSTHVAPSALDETRRFIAERYGQDFLPPSPRRHRQKVKGAQEAHEAIRPTSIFREPESVRKYLKPEQYRLYKLIWQRMVASQMADAIIDVTTVDIEGAPPNRRPSYLLRAANMQMRFPGFRQVYEEGRDDGEEEDLGKNPLPELASGDPLRLLDIDLQQRFTEPPPRYTEATLVKALEEKGIGRPSTYAPTMSTIQERNYVAKEGRYLKPTELGFVVNDILVSSFPDFVDVGFTAEMEDELDQVAGGERPWQEVVESVYLPLEDALAKAKAEVPKQVEETGEACPECGRPLVIRWGRRGRFLACSGYPECRFTRPLDGTEESGPEITEESCPQCSSPMVIRSGRFGKFLACSNYPRCKGTKPMGTGVRCPQDGGQMVERRSKRGKLFFGCENYPKCDFVLWNRPLPQPCPNCGGIITAAREGKARCTRCEWQGEAPQTAPTPEAAPVP